MEQKSFNIAIDGPAGAGKAPLPAGGKTAGICLCGYWCHVSGDCPVFFKKGNSVLRMCRRLPVWFRAAEITIRYVDGTQQVILNGEDVSGQIRTDEVGNMASATSASGVRLIFWSFRETWRPAPT